MKRGFVKTYVDDEADPPDDLLPRLHLQVA